MTHNQLVSKLEFVTGAPDSKSVLDLNIILSSFLGIKPFKGINLSFYDGKHWGNGIV